MSIQMPASPDALRGASFEEVEGYFEELERRPLDDVEAWLRDWSQLEGIFREVANEASVAYDNNTADPELEATHLRFSSDIDPRLGPVRDRLERRLVASGHTRPGLDTMIRRFRNSIELFREENVPLISEESRLGSAFARLQGGMLVEWEGSRVPPVHLRAAAADPDSRVRERAWRAYFRPYLEQRDEMASLFDALRGVRDQVARNSGIANYRDYAHRAYDRFDYTTDDCLRFHEAVEATVVPALERIYRRRASLLGYSGELVRPWDTIDGHVANPDPRGRAALRPFSTEAELRDGAQAIFDQVDPVLGSYFRRLVQEGVLDLMSRPGKAPGAYCTSFPARRLPYVFMNSTGVAGDVTTLLHEAGHAFHVFEAQAAQPLLFQQDTGSEIAEVASMTMELLGSPFIERSKGGFYSPEDAARARVDHLEDILASVAHIACVDAFQQWIYTDPAGADRDARDQRWTELRTRFVRGVDWTGAESERVARWYEQIHFFLYPFYYIEYGIAQMGALQVWRNSLVDRAGAVAGYRRALALGASRPLPELYAAAGARLVFDADEMGRLVELVEEEIDSLG